MPAQVCRPTDWAPLPRMRGVITAPSRRGPAGPWTWWSSAESSSRSRYQECIRERERPKVYWVCGSDTSETGLCSAEGCGPGLGFLPGASRAGDLPGTSPLYRTVPSVRQPEPPSRVWTLFDSTFQWTAWTSNRHLNPSSKRNS